VPERPATGLDRAGGSVVASLLGQVAGLGPDVDLPVGRDGVSFYRLISTTTVTRHAVLRLVTSLLGRSVGYVSHDIGEQAPG